MDLKLVVRRLRWLMLGVILFDMAITLIGQPASYWTDPSTVHEENDLYHIIMSKGIGFLFVTDLIYLTSSFFLVTFLPLRLALILCFSLILGHFFGGASWICFRYQWGVAGMVAYAIVLSAILAVLLCRPHKEPTSKSPE